MDWSKITWMLPLISSLSSFLRWNTVRACCTKKWTVRVRKVSVCWMLCVRLLPKGWTNIWLYPKTILISIPTNWKKSYVSIRRRNPRRTIRSESINRLILWEPWHGILRKGWLCVTNLVLKIIRKNSVSSGGWEPKMPRITITSLWRNGWWSKEPNGSWPTSWTIILL